MFENDHSAARGKMAVRGLSVFKHDSELGNATAYTLFDSVTVQRKPDVDAARSYRDYTVTVADALPEGVTCERLSLWPTRTTGCPCRASSTSASAAIPAQALP